MRDPENVDPSRLFQSGTEYWKAQYDFFKHLMTVNVALVAVFGAMLGGVFADRRPLGYTMPTFFTLLIFLGFFVSTAYATLATVRCRRNIRLMMYVENFDDFEELEKPQFTKYAMRSGASFLIALAGFFYFVLYAVFG